LREQIILISILILWASVAQGAVSDQAIGMDILGSRANNTTIIAPDGMPVEVNIVGSTASNIQIGYPTEVVNKKSRKECGPCGEEKRYETPWDDFKRPLCYPWSSYIPTRYSRSLIKNDPAYISTTPKILTLGSVTTKA
jgi:hypothetical protein